eukprot:1949680-Amphidinium_carterae.2
MCSHCRAAKAKGQHKQVQVASNLYERKARRQTTGTPLGFFGVGNSDMCSLFAAAKAKGQHLQVASNLYERKARRQTT